MLLLLTLLGLTGVNAAPIESNTAKCTVALTATNHGSAMANYHVNIGRPYIEGRGCGPINQTLSEGVDIGVYQYQCFTVDDGATTNLAFVSATGPATNIEVVDALQKAYPMVPFQKKRICLMDGVDAPSSWPSSKSKRNHNCDPSEPHDCDFHPENNTCLMTTGCHDDWIPANDSAICFYRVGWYDVRVGKPHLNCSGAAYVRAMLRETLPVGELTSISGGDVDFQCYEGPNNTTNLAIGVPNVYGDDVNRGLNLAYPGVGFDLNICPKCKDIVDGPWSGASCRK